MRIGVDLGGTKIEAIALDENGTEVARHRIPTIRDSYADTISSISLLVARIESDLRTRGTVGVGIPGTIIRDTGLVKNASSTWLNDKPLEGDLTEALNRPVRCANDANCFAVSEATDGAARGADVVFGVILGTGCGGGLALRGEVHAGLNGLAGEWGHIPLPWMTAAEYPGPPCHCGRYGCSELWVSGSGFEREFLEVTGMPRTGREIARMAETGDLQALAALDRLEERAARGLGIVLDILDPDVIVVGGGLSNIPRLCAGIERHLPASVFGRQAQTRVLRAAHGDSSGVRGAAWLWPAGQAQG